MIKRQAILKQIRAAFRYGRVVAILGPRQCGKTTLARQFVPPHSENYFDLEDPVSLARLSEPMTALSGLRGTVVLDEVQLEPKLFSVLRVLADRKPLPARFLILGSASPSLVKHSAESLAGRLARVEMGGFCVREVGYKNDLKLWLRGGFPLSFLAKTDADSFAWRKDLIMSFIEKDLPAHGMSLPPVTLLRFWTMLAHYHGQIWNAAEPARSLGISEMTVKRYLDILSGLFLVRQLQPWHANIQKRQVKTPKIYIRDTGILHQLLGIRTKEELLSHPKCGASWEGFVVGEVIRSLQPDEAFFWATHNGAELELIIKKDGKLYGIECKRRDAPAMSASMKIALKDLRLERMAVIYPGTRRYPLSGQVEVVPFSFVRGGMRAVFPPHKS
ncbi:MAG: ATP-binding protein [Candidatus Omnitrophota bacterium]